MTGHIDTLASDYILGVLPAGQMRKVVEHMAICSSCRQLVIQERKLATTIRQSVEVATRPDIRLINSLMPIRRTKQSLFVTFRRQLASAMLLIVIFVGAVHIVSGTYLQSINYPQSTALITLTNFAATPPSSVTASSRDGGGTLSSSRIVDSGQLLLPASSVPVPPLITPAPAPLPQPPG